MVKKPQVFDYNTIENMMFSFDLVQQLTHIAGYRQLPFKLKPASKSYHSLHTFTNLIAELLGALRRFFDLFEVTQHQCDELVTELERIQKARELPREPYEVVGDPIVELTLEADYKDKR